jgi:hypothetical protein
LLNVDWIWAIPWVTFFLIFFFLLAFFAFPTILPHLVAGAICSSSSP